MSSDILTAIFQLAIILIAANIVRPLFLRLRIPPVIGLILLGVLLGPSVLHFTEKTPLLNWIAEIGILLLIFSAGLETNINRLVNESKMALLPSLGGIIIPFGGGYAVSSLFGYSVQTSLMTGTIFTATSISISLMTLIEINKFNSIEGRCIVNSAIIDDILGIILISVVFSLSLITSGSTFSVFTDVGYSIIKILFFFIIAILFGNYFIRFIIRNSKTLNLENSLLSLTLSFIFLYAWFADLLGLAAIIGAFVCGLIMSNSSYREYIHSGVMTVGSSFFIDLFFIGVGLGLNLKTLSFKPLYQLLFILMAILSKITGSSLGALLARFDLTRAIRIGVGMVPRGEVTLILSSMAYERELIDSDILSTTIILVIISSLLTPFLLKTSFRVTRKKSFKLKNS